MLTLFRFLPFISHSEVLHFYTTLDAIFLDFLLFTLAYLQTLVVTHNDRKWKSSLVGCVKRCAAIAILALIFLVAGWRVSYIQRLLLDIFLLLITIQLWLHSGFTERRLAARNRKTKSETIFTHDGPSIATRKNLSADDDVTMLYAQSLADMQMTKEGLRDVDTVKQSCFPPPSISSFDSEIYAKLAAPKPSGASNSQRSSSYTQISSPLCSPEVTNFTQKLVLQEEKINSTWPEKLDHVNFGRLGKLAGQGNSEGSIEEDEVIESDKDNPVLPVVDIEALNRDRVDQRPGSMTLSDVEALVCKPSIKMCGWQRVECTVCGALIRNQRLRFCGTNHGPNDLGATWPNPPGPDGSSKCHECSLPTPPSTMCYVERLRDGLPAKDLGTEVGTKTPGHAKARQEADIKISNNVPPGDWLGCLGRALRSTAYLGASPDLSTSFKLYNCVAKHLRAIQASFPIPSSTSY